MITLRGMAAIVTAENMRENSGATGRARHGGPRDATLRDGGRGTFLRDRSVAAPKLPEQRLSPRDARNMQPSDEGRPAERATDRAATPRDDVRRMVDDVLSDRLDMERFAAWLERTASTPPTAGEIAGVADALRARMRRLPAGPAGGGPIADTCGTGGDGSGSFNISTAAALVVAAAGLPVAKHGNRAVSSRTGSADVLESLGVTIDVPPETAARCLAEAGICFCFAPAHHPALAKLGPLRRRIGRPTVFNLVGPLCNPAGADVQVIGVGRADAREPLAEAARLVGLARALVVSCEDGVDEVGLFAATNVIDVSPAGLRRLTWTPEDFGMATARESLRGELQAAGPGESAACIRGVLAGERGPRRDIVVLNAAAVLWAAGRADGLPAAAGLAAAAIDSGRALDVLERLRRASGPAAAHSSGSTSPS
jgi:anthranilate phosphoribosyltransferase